MIMTEQVNTILNKNTHVEEHYFNWKTIIYIVSFVQSMFLLRSDGNLLVCNFFKSKYAPCYFGVESLITALISDSNIKCGFTRYIGCLRCYA